MAASLCRADEDPASTRRVRVMRKTEGTIQETSTLVYRAPSKTFERVSAF